MSRPADWRGTAPHVHNAGWRYGFCPHRKVAVPPDLQPTIAQRALELGKPVFLEEPLAADLVGAQIILESARKSARPTIIDFNFPELPSWQRAKAILDGGAIGRLQNVVVTWNFESRATRLHLDSWKTRGEGGGGLLGNFVSHCFHNLEWLCGFISGLAARVFALPDRNADGSVAVALSFASGAGGSLQVSGTSFLGSGHHIELYGDSGTLVLSNPTTDYFRGFELRLGRQGDDALKLIAIGNVDEEPFSDSRVAPVRRLVCRLIDACEHGGDPMPGVAEGYRVQCLIDATRRAHAMDRRRPAGRASVTISMGVWKKCPSCGTRWISARCCRQLNAEVYMPNSALFLDRDGVVNVDRGYIHRSEQFEFVPGIFDLARFWTNELRRPIVVVTNQSGIGRGYFDERAYADLTRWMCDRFEAEGTAIARVYHCPYHPQDGIGEYRCDHPWRKPKPGMLLQAVSDLGLDPAHCAILGDKISDIEAGAAAGIGLLVRIGSRDAKMAEPLHDVVADLREALALFRFHFRSHFATAVPDQRRRDP